MMNSLEIAYRLRLLGKKQSDIARELNISPQVVHKVIGGQITAHAVATYISNLLDCTPQELWPGCYVFKPRASFATKYQYIKNGKEDRMT